jgi:hypothetical protein
VPCRRWVGSWPRQATPRHATPWRTPRNQAQPGSNQGATRRNQGATDASSTIRNQVQPGARVARPGRVARSRGPVARVARPGRNQAQPGATDAIRTRCHPQPMRARAPGRCNQGATREQPGQPGARCNQGATRTTTTPRTTRRARGPVAMQPGATRCTTRTTTRRTTRTQPMRARPHRAVTGCAPRALATRGSPRPCGQGLPRVARL